MSEEELFNIQANQLNKEIEKIKWIAENSDHLIRALRREATEHNAGYFEKDKPHLDMIFRGDDFCNFINNYISVKS